MERRELQIALAGIVATAVVGVAGAAMTFVTARENSHSQESIARQSRVYELRASAYIDALTAENEWLISQTGVKFKRWVDKWARIHPVLRARMEAYGSDRALHGYDQMMFALLHHSPDVASKVNSFSAIVRGDLGTLASR